MVALPLLAQPLAARWQANGARLGALVQKMLGLRVPSGLANLAAEIEDLKSENNSLLALIEQTHHVHKLAKRHRTLRRPQPFWRATPLPDPRRPARGLADPLTLMVAVLLNKKLLGLNF